MSQETVKERRMAERGREKGRRTAADTEREELARSGTDRSGYQKTAAPKLLQESRRAIGARDRLRCRERSEKNDDKEKRSGYLRQNSKSPR